MSHARPSRRIATILTALISTSLLAIAVPAGAQARTHHHIRPAAGHTAPYTRLVVPTRGFEM